MAAEYLDQPRHHRGDGGGHGETGENDKGKEDEDHKKIRKTLE